MQTTTSVPTVRVRAQLRAPIFNVRDIFGRQINLEAYADKKVFIGFFRHAGCPFCNIRVHTLTKIHQELQAQGLEMIFFFESKEAVLLRSTFHQEVSPIPLIADPEKTWYDAYGIEQSAYKSAVSHITTFVQTAWKAHQAKLPIHTMADGESIKTMPAEFLLSEGLIVERLHYAQALNDRLSVQTLRDFAAGKGV